MRYWTIFSEVNEQGRYCPRQSLPLFATAFRGALYFNKTDIEAVNGTLFLHAAVFSHINTDPSLKSWHLCGNPVPIAASNFLALGMVSPQILSTVLKGISMRIEYTSAKNSLRETRYFLRATGSDPQKPLKLRLDKQITRCRLTNLKKYIIIK